MIEKLKELVLNKENEVNKVKKLKEFFHLELLNREKNYNELFGNIPNIVISEKNNTNQITSIREIPKSKNKFVIK